MHLDQLLAQLHGNGHRVNTRLKIAVATVSAITVITSGASAAWAYFASSGNGATVASVGSLPAPTNVGAARVGTNVTVSWTGSAAPIGGAVDGYRVDRLAVDNS